MSPLSGVETIILAGFTTTAATTMTTPYEQGLATRKAVMGEDFVAASFANATPFTAPIQEHITRAWT